MTKRESKAVELIKASTLGKNADDVSLKRMLKSMWGESLLQAMQWQAEQCVELCTEVFDQYEPRPLPLDMEECIRNAGTEVV